eukprot:scaffold217537_cov39-Prasinocladus_malaysianus.AAC.1
MGSKAPLTSAKVDYGPKQWDIWALDAHHQATDVGDKAFCRMGVVPNMMAMSAHRHARVL